MAFYQDPGPTNDPNYLRQSKEPDKIAPLQQVAIPANRNTDTSFGELFKGIGNVLGTAVTAADGVIKRNIKSDADAEIDPIRNAAGANLTPEEAAQIAGTGAKGRARIAEMGNGGALFGPASTDGGDVAAPDANPRALPADAQQELAQVKRMNDAKAAGALSDSYYNAQLVAVVKKLKARYGGPDGYSEEVDQAVSQITGITPANALRRSLLADMNANAIAKLGAASEQAKWEDKNAAQIVLDRPDYFQNKAKYAGQEQTIRSDVYVRQGREAYIKSQEAEMGFDAQRAQGTAQMRADMIARDAVSSMGNSAGMGDAQNLATKLAGLKNGANPTDLAELNNTIEALKAKKAIEIRTTFSTPIEGRTDGMSYNGIIKDQGKIDGIVSTALSPLTAIQDALKNKSFDQAATIANTVMMTKNQAAKEILDKVPAVKFLGGLSVAGGDQAVGVILQGSNLLPQLQKSLVDSKLIETMGVPQSGKPPPGIGAQAADLAKGSGGAINSAALKSLVEGNMKIIQSKMPDGVSEAGVRNLFDQDFFANINQNERLKTWTMMGSPHMSERIAELSKKDPSLMAQYASWQKYAFQATFAQDIGNAKGGMEDPRFTPHYDADNHQIVMEPKPGMLNKAGPRGTQIGDAYVGQVNQGLTLIASTAKAQGLDPNVVVLDAIKGMGLNLDAQTGQAGGGLLQEVGRTIKQMFIGPPDGEGQPTKAIPKGRLSLYGAPEPELRDAIGKAEAGGDYNNVFGMGKDKSRDLSAMTVGEVMALQAHHVASGSPSSAAGKYQFLRATLNSLVKSGDIDVGDKFTPDTQDNLAVALMKRRGLDDYRAGKITKAEFADRLAAEWAGLKGSSGKGRYDGDGLNRATADVMSLLSKESYGSGGRAGSRYDG